MSYPLTLGDVTVEVVSGVMVPAQPNVEPSFNWPTLEMAMGTPVRMADNGLWRVFRPPAGLQDARIQVVLRDPVRRITASINVPADCLDLPVWNVGYALPVPVAEDPPVVVEPVDPPPALPAPPE